MAPHQQVCIASFYLEREAFKWYQWIEWTEFSREDIQINVKMFRPTTLRSIIGLARLQEEKYSNKILSSGMKLAPQNR